ncbi:FAD/NAD(P)-binding protein [Amaricoccus tamworthensis]|uniref:FAD/NAD(P)-binding protein n=1 Tax=Amaricoccus tamworthensis TaxID=57002 RepID=UPI003C7E4EDD
MNKDVKTRRIAVVGFGPRGLGALEALADCMADRDLSLAVDMYDANAARGAGPNFDPDESPLCLLNIPNRDINIRPPGFSKLGGFTDWSGPDCDPDAFPPRAELGRYLRARSADLLGRDSPEITPVAGEVERITRDGSRWRIETAQGASAVYDEVLLTLGQPPVSPDDQLAEWRDHAARTTARLAGAYPAKTLIGEAANWTGRTVAVRGLALSFFDVLRALTAAQGGRFEQGRYTPSGQEPARIVPFSLDGKPPFPKPATEEIDAWFDPLDTETTAFETAMATASQSDPDTARHLITTALIPVADRILKAQGADLAGVYAWLDTEWSDPGSQETGDTFETLRHGVALAEGTAPLTIGYTLGQIWRKWQDQVRAGYNPATTPPESAKIIVGFDEGMKRYSYGPPVSSAREMLAVIDAGLIDLDFAADPDIDLTDDGWTLTSGAGTAEASVMIDAVLPPPDPASVTAPLIRDLMDRGVLASIDEGLSANTAADGGLIDADGQDQPGLCLLGRLALGSVIAVDSLHDCFGEASRRWARGVCNRLTG